VTGTFRIGAASSRNLARIPSKPGLKPENYRSASILSIVSKVVEKAVYKQLEKFLISNNLLFEFQSGFRSSYSTDSCLIHLIDHIKTETARGL
jgi:hypothetical protein